MNNIYFENFPVILYGNTNIRDISRRVVLDPNVRQSPNAFNPYDLTEDQRSDVLAYNYYGDQNLDWMIYLANGIVDSYFGWFLRQDEFNEFLINKYGSIELPTSKIAYWETNWADDDLTYAPNYYARLPINLQKYFIPKWGPNSIIGYNRNPTDWYVNINALYEVKVTNTAQFSANQMVQTVNGFEVVEGTGIIETIIDNQTLHIIQPIQSWNVGDNLQIWTSNAGFIDSNGVEITSVKTLNTSIPNDELVYWSPITYYEVERQLNESRKTLLIINKTYVSSISNFLAKSLNT